MDNIFCSLQKHFFYIGTNNPFLVVIGKRHNPATSLKSSIHFLIAKENFSPTTEPIDPPKNEYSNIHIIKDDENLNDTLKKSKVLIHYNCTTSFEFFLLKKHKTLMPNFFTSFKYLKYNFNCFTNNVNR